MEVLYNISLDLKEEGAIPFELYSKIRQKYSESGFLGEKHVNLIGRVFNRYASSCSIYKKGFFEFFLRDSEKLRQYNLKELLEIWGVKANSDREKEIIELGKECLSLLEEKDNLVNLPFSVYSQISHAESLEILTPAGRQSLHVHTEDGDIIQFWKPKKGFFWYDFDSLRNYLLGVSLENEVIDIENNRGYRKFIKKIRREFSNKLWIRLNNNPDSIKVLPPALELLLGSIS